MTRLNSLVGWAWSLNPHSVAISATESWDAIIGSSYAELMPLFEADPETQAIAIYSEPGGRMEAELADWMSENDSRRLNVERCGYTYTRRHYVSTARFYSAFKVSRSRRVNRPN